MRIMLLLSLLTLAGPAHAAAPTEIRFCLEDKAIYPLYNKPGLEDSKYPGILVEFARHVSRKHGVKLNLMRRPPTACRVLMKAGSVDAYGIVSYRTDREDWAVYPKLPDGTVDTRTIFKQSGYFLYSRQDKVLPWDGTNLGTLKGLRIGSSEGYSINEELKAAGASVETFKSVDAMYTRLMEKQLDGLALHSNRINKKLNMGLRKYEGPLKMNDYYFTFSKAFYENHKEFCEKIWKDSVMFEESAEGKKAMTGYESLDDFPRE
ncbi:MAG TPA: transporter substrate-binding domain-containing protein [Oligoflexus sp.]|uniref:substrate-binding periplasmic protein n=1 Tax=Oligoflexus sp. TaxID=1971216 RepID=UPI002D7EAAB0|nr:transporter substrate-binding domain-containing protein [Oligoflexus sp.]HET9238091.1 transporter substrate-binding domain-containing protein [Oligoflexus sp.]